MYGNSINTVFDRIITLGRAMDEAVNTGRAGSAQLWYPTMDVFETKDAYVLETDLPGVSVEDVEINFERNTLTLRGERKSAIRASEGEQKADFRIHSVERVWGSFARSIRLPEYVDGTQIEATFANGVLSIRIPKAQSALPRKIEVKTTSSESKQLN